MPDPTATKYAAYLAIHRAAGTTPRSFEDWSAQYERARYALTGEPAKGYTPKGERGRITDMSTSPTNATQSPPTSQAQATDWLDGAMKDDSGKPKVVWHAGTVGDGKFLLKHTTDVGHHFGSHQAASAFGTPRPYHIKAQRLLRVKDGGDTAGWAKSIADGLEQEDPVAHKEAITGLRSLAESFNEYMEEADEDVPKVDYDAFDNEDEYSTAEDDRAIEVESRAAKAYAAAIRSWLKDLPHDAIVYQNAVEGNDEDSYIVFRGNKHDQIRPANIDQDAERYALTAQEINEAVKDWSPPTEAQKEAGNYQKPTIHWNGLRIKIENPAGTRRKPEWPELKNHYGYLSRTVARDSDAIDVFLGPKMDSDIVFVVDQERPSGRYDEPKVLIGWTNAADAKAGYLSNYSPGWRCGPVTAMTIDQFKAWLERGDTKSRVAEQVSRYTAASSWEPGHAPLRDIVEGITRAFRDAVQPDPLDEPERYARKHLKSSAGQQSLHFESAAPTGKSAWTAEDERKHPRGPDGEWVEKGEGAAKPAPRPKAPEPDQRLQDHVANLHDAMQERLGAGKQFLARHAGKPLWISSGDHVRIADDGTTLEHTDPDGKWVRADLAQLDHWADKAGVDPFTGPEGILTKQETADARDPAPAGTTAPEPAPAPKERPGDLAGGNGARPPAGESLGGSGTPEKLKGGRADDRPDRDFDPEALAKGTKVEREHTDDPQQAKEIAKDHLIETPDQDYYDELEAMEEQDAGQQSNRDAGQAGNQDRDVGPEPSEDLPAGRPKGRGAGPRGQDLGAEPPAADQGDTDEPPADEAQPEGPAGDALDQVTHRDIDDMVNADAAERHGPDSLKRAMYQRFKRGLDSGEIDQAKFDEMVKRHGLEAFQKPQGNAQQDARYKEYLDQTRELDQLLGNYYPLSRQEWDRAGLGGEKYEETKDLMAKRLAFARETRQKQDATAALEKTLGQFAQHKGVLYQRKEGPRGPEWNPAPGERGYPIGHETMLRHAQAGDATPVKPLEVQLWIQKKMDDLKAKATAEQRRKMEAIEQAAKRETSQQVIMDRPPPGGWTEADKVPEQPEAIRHRTAQEQHGAPWQHTRKEWDQLAGGYTGHHYTSAVQRAIRAGEPVPDRVIDSDESFQITKAYADIDKEFTSEQHALMDRPTTELTEDQFLKQASLKSLRDNKRQILQYDRELKKLGPKAKKDRENREMWKRLAQESIKRIESGEDLEKNREYRRQKYRDTIKQAISRGFVTDPQIIAQYPEFKLARTARERYEKGRHTSFANRSIAVDDSMQGQHGYKVKRQDGKPITPEQRDEIHRGIQEIHQAVGDLTDLYRHTDVTLAHTSGKHPFLSQIGGCYHPSDKSVTFGTNILGILPIRAQAHELGHWLDYEAGRAMGWQGKAHLYSANWKSRGRGHVVDTTAVSQFQSQNPRDPASTELFRIAADNMNDEREVRRLTTAKLKDASSPEQKAEIEKAKVVLGPYWHSPHEIFARLFEQYVADQNGNRPDLVSAENRYATSAGYWAPEVWQRIKPLVEKEIQRRIALIRGAIPKEGTDDDQQ